MNTGDRTRAVFVVGSPRSGTSVLAWALAQHETMATGPEADFPYWVAKLFEVGEVGQSHAPDTLRPLETAWQVCRLRPDGWANSFGVGRDEFMAALGEGLDRLFSKHLEGKRWVDSTPAAALVLPQLAKMFPKAQFVHIVRDGRAAVSSMINSGFDMRIATDFEFACQTWSDHASRGHKYAAEQPERCIQIRQEDMAEDPGRAMEPVLSFLGLEGPEPVVEFLGRGRINSSWGNKTAEDVKTLKSHDVGPKTPWKDWSWRQERVFRKVAGETMKLLGYDPTPA